MTINKLLIIVILVGIATIFNSMHCIKLKCNLKNLENQTTQLENSRQSSKIEIPGPTVISVGDFFPEGTRIIAETSSGFTVTYTTYYVKDGKLVKSEPI